MRGPLPCGSSNMFRLLLVVAAGLCFSDAQVVQEGQCETLSVQAGFEVANFTGQWYEISRIPNTYSSSDCGYIQFSTTATGLQVSTSGLTNNFLELANGTATYDANDTARITISMEPLSTDIDFWILETDYQIYALAYGCQNVDNNTRSITLWKLSRVGGGFNELINSYLDNTILRELGLVASQVMVDSDFSEDACYVLPVIEEGQAIVLPGQCNDNITAVLAFNFAGFLGTWNEISSYQTDNSLGSCPYSLFSAIDSSTIGVVNSGVVNQTQQTNGGTVVISSEDGSAVLNLTLEVSAGVYVSSELKILATDYQNYALSYSCVNVDATQKRVYSWIHSRTKQLSAASLTAVNTVINSNVDLNERYYTVADHSSDGCFYLPDLVEGQIVVFPGSCNTTISVMENFDAELYMGLWHIIENYPSDTQYGTCNNANYTRTEAGFLVHQTQVINQTLDYTNGAATEVDGASLTITLPFPDTNILSTINYWVLDTDYTSYALVYSCENLSDDRSRVWSWKLSRTKTLTVNASQAIDTISSTINVLDQRYYQTQDQSAEGCFFYPEPVAGQAVVFPGQCDESIAAVPAFNISQFSGRWFEIESYPKAQLPGQCVSHDYEYSNNVFSVISDGVNDQFQYSANGTFQTDATDGSARFIAQVNFQGSVVSLPYWILATDYDSYALAYSCVNLNSDYRGIWSWKLSRTTELTAAAVTAINAVTAPIVVLDDDYFESTDQSEEACFYLPELETGEPVVLAGQCDPNVAVVQNFDATAYSGTWRLIESYPTEFQNGSCNDATYTLDGNSVIVVNTQVINETLDSITGSAVAIDDSGKLLVTFPVAGTNATVSAEYWVLDTDYTSYSLVYSCENVTNETRRIWSWKLSRTRQLSQAAVTAIDQVVNSVQVLNNRFYEIMDQSDEACFYYPEPSDSPVVFRGTCNISIPAVANFDIDAFSGLWHDIDIYPSAYQQGNCNNILYALNDGTIDVLATQVTNQTLDSSNGFAMVSTADGTGKLQVHFSGASAPGSVNVLTTLDYWVLDTDYDSFAFVYSCDQINADERQIYSWKLSRTKQMPAAGITAINNIINTVQVLDDRYYQSTDQSVDGCFYYPEPVSGQTVIFPGQCDENVATVQNFNLSQFSGRWFEIESYPKAQLPGQCVSHDYEYSDNVFSVISNGVEDEFQYSANGTFQTNSTDGSARFIAQVNVQGNVVSLPYWILATDYDSYALAYSCVNLNSDFRGIWSWKLSRTTELTAAAVTAINAVTAPIVVLDDDYFESTDQSEEACFYLPEFETGEPVVLPGQCDPNVAVVQNFDATAYSGTWRLIESYPTEFQNGSCNDATYTLDGNSVIVVNTQVINETLDSITGSAVAIDDSGKLLVTFPVAGTNATVSAEYWVLDTDYTSYSLVYSCENLTSETRRIWSWKLSRNRQLSQAAVTAINQVIDTVQVLNDRYYEIIDQSDEACFYYPEPSDFPVVFRGTCNISIPAVANFDIDAFSGLWHDIDIYPSAYQQGNCNNILYALNDGTIDVLATQVTNQTLDSSNGFAMVSTADGTGKLQVHFSGASAPGSVDVLTTLDYWVLDTDYDSFAFVYSCDQINAEERQIYSWKLSRTKQMPAAGITAINNIINTVQVLDDRYYQSTDQSVDGCFYYPEPVSGQTVIFPGQCDENVATVQNFNLSQFEGLWHEIATYPRVASAEVSNEQCVNYQFTQTSDSDISIVGSFVENFALGASNGTAVLTSTDGSGRFTITDLSNTDVTVPFWVIATDYDNYALGYTCINLENDMRAVRGYKYSRTQELSAASEAAITQAMSPVVVLEERYFEAVPQSDDDCFYLPELTLEEPVIMIGQCDENISVIQNFDPTRYEGRWYDIASYYDAFQTGTCNDAQYTLTSGGIVDVYNTQVVNQTLDSINGTATAAADGSGRLVVTFPIAGTDFTVTSNYWILDTDYDNYALVYSCNNLANNTRRVYSWKLSRTRELTASSSTAIAAVVNTVPVLDDRFYITRDHSEAACFYYPDVDPLIPVTFRGQCPSDVQAFPAFDPARYMGIWYDVGSYPQEFQFGSCPTARYTLNDDGTVEVYNTQVVEQQLEDIYGVATLDSDDGSAKLIVAFPIAGTPITIEAPYWVLDTDYDNYAVVYACINLSEEFYRVTSWRLSRDQSPANVSEDAFTQILSQYRDLNEDYYIYRGTADEDCFYYPDNFGGPVVLDGVCDTNQTVVTDFNITQFSGTWHEISRFPSELQTGDCASSVFQVNNQQITVSQNIVLNELQNTIAGAVTLAQDGNGVLTVTYLDSAGATQTLTVYVLATDYTSYALLFSCADRADLSKQVYSWKLSRSREGLSQAAIGNINPVVSNNLDLFEGYYQETDQGDYSCFHYPQFDDNAEAIVLPGPCNDTIQAIPNFDFDAYLGRWYEVARYPQGFQNGQCSRATLGLDSSGGILSIEDVANQTLVITTESISVASGNGSGMLQVAIGVGGEDSISIVTNYDLYVLDTDYNNYALVYQCTNLDDGNRQVSSWKLSRSPTLDAQYEPILDPIIAASQGLSQDYYRTTSQSDANCFYVPELNENEAVLFRGQCGDVTGVTGFDIERYLGWWHEIESYPTATDGQCISSQIQSSGNQYLAVNTTVVGVQGIVDSSVVQVSADGRLRRTLSNGEIYDVWVLATDYDNYALLYSCVNVNDEYRRVWSAKHSKTRQLPANAEAAFAPLIAANDLLQDHLYVTVSQSDEDCFHYPAPTGEQVILPGQCDENIPAQQNFDAVEYSGIWYQTERYPQVHESGTCTGASYTLDEETGVVSVLNWEVRDGEVVTIEGTATLSSTDGSGKLTVVLPVEGSDEIVSLDLYVLATDYITYSLAYSCQNVNDYQRALGVWKLSRTRDMPASGTAAINAVIAQREELHQQYFIQVEQNDDCPEPSSAMLFRSSLIVMLICAVWHLAL